MSDLPGDHDRVRELLGREPRGRYEVVVRDSNDNPIVLQNSPLLDDGTPMPTRYWLIGPAETKRIGRLEAAGGVDAAESAVDPDELAAAHDRYAAERDAAIPADHVGPRPHGGVGGTRVGVKCLHAHWAWHLAGGDDPVGRWIAARLDVATIELTDDRTVVRHGGDDLGTVPWGPRNLTSRWLDEADPPAPESLTNALGAVDDYLDDIARAHPGFSEAANLTVRGAAATALARIEIGADQLEDQLDATAGDHVVLARDDAEEIFRMVATEPASDRAHNPGLPSHHVETIVATCCIVLAFMRRLHLDHVRLDPSVPA